MNIISYGFTHDTKDHFLDVRVAVKDDNIILRIKDDCIPFDPEEAMKLATDPSPESGMGIRLVFSCASEIKYQSILGLNALTIWLRN